MKSKNGFVEKRCAEGDDSASGVASAAPHVECGGAQEVLFANPCAGVEFPARVDGLFRPHYVSWSEQQRIELHAPEYLRNVIRIITETGLRVYKELTPMKKDQVDLDNRTVWIPDSKTPNGVAEVPLTEIAAEAFRRQIAIAGPGQYLFPSDGNPDGYQQDIQDRLACDVAAGRCSVFSHLRSSFDLRYPAQRRRRCGRMGHAVAAARGCEGVQEVLADETTDEARSAAKLNRQANESG